jgi:hypothetical protein
MSESSYPSFASPMAKLFSVPLESSGTALPDVPGSRGVSGELLGAGGGFGLQDAQADRVGIVVLCGSALGAGFCGSFIGSHRKRMCIRADCNTGSHSKSTSKAVGLFSEVGGEEQMAFICYKSDTSSVYTDPVKRGGDFGPGLQRFLSTKRTVQAWTSLFSLPAGSQPQTDEDAEDIVNRADRVVPVGLTPRTKKARFTMDSPGEIVDDFAIVDVPAISVAQPREFASSLGASWPIMQKNQSHMAARVERVRLGSAKLAKDLSEDLDTFEVRFDRVQRVLGDWPEEFATSNLCEVTTDLIGDVDKVVDRVKALENVPTLNPKQIESDTAQRLSEWMAKELQPLYLLYAKLSSALNTPGDRFESIVTRVVALESSRAVVSTQQRPASGPSGIASLFQTQTAGLGPTPMDTTDAIDVEAEIRELKDQLQAVREELMDDRVEISTIAFVSEVQSHSWMYANCVPADTFYRYYDAVSLLTILTHSGVTISEEMTMDKNAKSGSFVNKEAATFAASFALELPEIFGKETSINQHRDDRELPAIRTHSEWDSGTGHSGAKNTIMKALSKNVKSIRRHMNRYFSGDAQMVAETMLTDSQAFLTELCNWISRHHFELITRTESDAATVWSLVAHDVRVIFQLLFEARGPGRNTGEPQHFFWGTLRAHKVMQELRAYNFSGHPQLGHALNQHLQDNAVMKASFHALEKTVESLKRDVALALKTADKAASKK